MAEITLRLICYRLGEMYKNMVVRYDRLLNWYADFSWKRVDVLDMLVLGWILLAFVVVGVINLYVRFFGLPRTKPRQAAESAGSPADDGSRWVNTVISWISSHYHHTPEFVDSWLNALNEQARNQSGNVQIRFEKIQTSNSPPKLSRLSTDLSSAETLKLQLQVECADLTFLVSVQEASGSQPAICDVLVSSLLGQLQFESICCNEVIESNVGFSSPPQLVLKTQPRSYETSIDHASVEAEVRQAIGSAVTIVHLSTQGGYPSFSAKSPADKIIARTTGLDVAIPRPKLHDQPVPNQSSFDPSPNRQLFVKVIKANGLGRRDLTLADPYCVVRVADPPQQYVTSTVKNTVNPFWDEHFTLDLEDITKEVKFEVYDREKRSGEDFLGRAVLSMEDLHRVPSSRQIIPLTGRPDALGSTSGSITVEVMFVEANAGTSAADTVSPRRRIHTSRAMTPGGTVVTTTTMTTEKPRDHRVDPSYGDMPNMVEKAELDFMDFSADYSGSQSSSQLGAHEAGLSASQELSSHLLNGESVADTALRQLRERSDQHSRATPKTSTIIITGVHREPVIPLIKTTDSSPIEDHHEEVNYPTLTPAEQKASPDEDTVSSLSAAEKKSKSFTSTLKRKFQRGKKSRSQSADRASSMREGSLLRPPAERQRGAHAADETSGTDIPSGKLRKSRSHSFSSSLRRLFKRKSHGGGGGDISRDSSISRASGYADTSRDVSRDGSVIEQSPPRDPASLPRRPTGDAHDVYAGANLSNPGRSTQINGR